MTFPGVTARYENTKYDEGTTCCDVDTERPDLARYPRYAHASPLQCELGVGDVLFIPRYWYHQVLTTEDCVSVNYFASLPLELMREGLPRYVLRLLHQSGKLSPRNAQCLQSAVFDYTARPIRFERMT